MNTIPLWVVTCLGKQVALKVDHQADPRLPFYPAGHLVKLQSIEAGEDGPYACVQMDPEDWGNLENFSFDDIRPLAGTLGCFDMEQGLIRQL
jgi:hypothetical protein